MAPKNCQKFTRSDFCSLLYIQNFLKWSSKSTFKCLILPDLSQISETSPEMIRFVSSVRVNFAETLSNFYHNLHVWYHDNSTNFVIFRLRLLFIEFSDFSATRFCSCFANTMFEISGLALDTVSKQTQWQEYHFFIHFFGYSKHLQFKSKKLPKIHLTKINWWNIIK